MPQVPFRLLSSQFQELSVPYNIREQELGHPRLAGPEKLTRSPNFKILFRNLESILGLAQDVDTLVCLLRAQIFGHQNAESRVLTTPDSSSELMELRETESLGMLDHHEGSAGNIDTHFDYSCRDKHLNFTRPELAHEPAFFLHIEPTVHQHHG